MRKDYDVEAGYKEVWLDEESKILAFHEIERSTRVEMPEEQFWIWVMEVIKSGYRIM